MVSDLSISSSLSDRQRSGVSGMEGHGGWAEDLGFPEGGCRRLMGYPNLLWHMTWRGGVWRRGVYVAGTGGQDGTLRLSMPEKAGQ